MGGVILPLPRMPSGSVQGQSLPYGGLHVKRLIFFCEILSKIETCRQISVQVPHTVELGYNVTKGTEYFLSL
jgi:hypothetical protein